MDSRILVVDDDLLVLDSIRYALARPDTAMVFAQTAEEGLRQFTHYSPDVVILDVRLPDLSGLELFQQIHQLDSKVPVIFITGYGTAHTAIEAMRMGAFDYVVKPLDPDQLADLVTRAMEISRLMRVPAVLPEGDPVVPGADLLIGQCAAMQELYKLIGRVAPQNVTVLICGESGTGKELVARAVYYYSKRKASPFLAINCAAIPEALLESELFGHEKGSFTGADQRHIGKFEQCNGGTLFLDEIGDMSLLTQTKLLRVLQEQCFERVGGNEAVTTDVRIIAATNRDLEQLIAEGGFRRDLYYRLNVCLIRLKPLRQRLEDLPLLVQYFLQRFSRELGREVHAVSPEAMELLRRYSWPGNVRELQSVLKRAVVHTASPILLPEDLPTEIQPREDGASGGSAGASPSELMTFIRERLHEDSVDLYSRTHDWVDRQLLSEVLGSTRGNVSQAARILGIARQTMRTRLAELGIQIERNTAWDNRRPTSL